MFCGRLVDSQRDRDVGEVPELERMRRVDRRRGAYRVLVAVPIEVHPLLGQHVLEDRLVFVLAPRPVRREVVGVGEGNHVRLRPCLRPPGHRRERPSVEAGAAERVVELSDRTGRDPEKGPVVGLQRVHELLEA